MKERKKPITEGPNKVKTFLDGNFHHKDLTYVVP